MSNFSDVDSEGSSEVELIVYGNPDEESSDLESEDNINLDERRKAAGAFVVAGFVALLIFILSTDVKPIVDQTDEEQFLSIPDEGHARRSLESVVTSPVLAGSKEAKAAAEQLKQQFQDLGIPEVETFEYSVWMSGAPTTRSLTAPNFVAQLTEPTIPHDPMSSDPRVVPPFNAYSASARVAGEAVYINYGRVGDFEALAKTGVNLTGKLALARYGQTLPAAKVYLAELYKMKGVVLFSDPLDDGGVKRDAAHRVYPDGPYRPPQSIRSDAVQYVTLAAGDPLTPGVAAVPDLKTRKYTEGNATTLPQIPVLPISAEDAKKLLSRLEGQAVTALGDDWQGGFDLVYHVGGTDSLITELHVEADAQLRTVRDVIATIPGSDPDCKYRTVMMGSHFDSWGFGVADGHSGTVAMLEVARAMGVMYQQGWRPKRTIVFCAWDGAEFGMLGSTEFAEQFQARLTNTGVAYLNLDVAVSGADFAAQASPLLSELVWEAAKSVSDPAGGTVFEQWKKLTGEGDSNPSIGFLGTGSDYAAFFHFLGMPSLDVRFEGNQFGVYHSAYDSLNWMTKFGDPRMHYHVQLAKLFGVMAFRLATVPVLPFSVHEYVTRLSDHVSSLATFLTEKEHTEDIVKELKLGAVSTNLDLLISKEKEFTAVAVKLKEDSAPHNCCLRAVNDRLTGFEQAFLSTHEPLFNRKDLWYRHTVYAPSVFDGTKAAILPGILEPYLFGKDVKSSLHQTAVFALSLERATECLELSDTCCKTLITA